LAMDKNSCDQIPVKGNLTKLKEELGVAGGSKPLTKRGTLLQYPGGRKMKREH